MPIEQANISLCQRKRMQNFFASVMEKLATTACVTIVQVKIIPYSDKLLSMVAFAASVVHYRYKP
jgi:hypothetical protein